MADFTIDSLSSGLIVLRFNTSQFTPDSLSYVAAARVGVMAAA
jgi:hypothetical protein